MITKRDADSKVTRESLHGQRIQDPNSNVICPILNNRLILKLRISL